MDNKHKKIIITFFTSTDAMATEKVCNDNNLKGRIITTPRHITADCGMSYIIGIDKKEMIEKLLSNEKIKYDKIIEIEV